MKIWNEAVFSWPLSQPIFLSCLIGEIQCQLSGVSHNMLKPKIEDNAFKLYPDYYIPDRWDGWYPACEQPVRFLGWLEYQLPERLIDILRAVHSNFPGVGFYRITLSVLRQSVREHCLILMVVS